MPQYIPLVVMVVLACQAGLVEGARRRGKSARSAQPVPAAPAGDAQPLSPEVSVLMAAVCLGVLFLCVWLSNRLHDSQEKEKKEMRKASRLRSKLETKETIVVPQIIPAKPRHPRIITEATLSDA
ncbi:hypothetical protein DIPPA_23583 [Diplonema papillatum]|nr:hypothetical protein DIPPA_23583 [Diplonema papillatum]